ncbi:hypothetical protein Tco_1538092 [Tanacetum coccineum]
MCLLGRRVDVKTHLLGGAIDSSKANGIIRDPNLELESSRFTFDLVPFSYESVDVVVGENWLLRHKAEMYKERRDLRRCCCFESLEAQAFVFGMIAGVAKVRVGSNDKVQNSIWRDVRTLAIEEAYTTKYSIHPGADTMLCAFRLANRWLSMKKDIASCGSKYLAYLEVEVEYQGSSGLLPTSELPVLEVGK